jgi:hypothetical protein
MATQQYIINTEDIILRTCDTVDETIRSLNYEVSANNGHCGVNPENSDCWGTLAQNAGLLMRRLQVLVDTINMARTPTNQS